MPIKRDKLGIICQHSLDDPNYLDGGDASRSTGIMACFGSEEDLAVVHEHCDGFGFVRHPEQEKWNDYRNFSRDQLIPLLAGLRAKNDSRLTGIARTQLEGTIGWPFLFGIGFAPNLDPLGWDSMWHYILCARYYPLYWFAPMGYFAQIIHILFNCFVTPMEEQNQVICMVHTSGLGKFYRTFHPCWKESLRVYWGGWRDQSEIAEFMIQKFREG